MQEQLKQQQQAEIRGKTLMDLMTQAPERKQEQAFFFITGYLQGLTNDHPPIVPNTGMAAAIDATAAVQ